MSKLLNNLQIANTMILKYEYLKLILQVTFQTLKKEACS